MWKIFCTRSKRGRDLRFPGEEAIEETGKITSLVDLVEEKAHFW
jgi:hypothetical protein